MAWMMLSQQAMKTETMQPMMLVRRRLDILRSMSTAVSTKLEKHREPNEVVRLCLSASNVLPRVTPPKYLRKDCCHDASRGVPMRRALLTLHSKGANPERPRADEQF
jgi:hypothetical protein